MEDKFLEYADYRVVAGEAAFRSITQSQPEVVDQAELEAIEEVCGYLRPKYDVEAVFSARGEDRNARVVMVTVDVALYHMVASQPQRMGYEIRETRYKRAVEWLEDVSSGKVVPDLPLAGGADASAPDGGELTWGARWKRGNEW